MCVLYIMCSLYRISFSIECVLARISVSLDCNAPIERPLPSLSNTLMAAWEHMCVCGCVCVCVCVCVFVFVFVFVCVYGRRKRLIERRRERRRESWKRCIEMLTSRSCGVMGALASISESGFINAGNL
jgi:hypothetical protein